MKTSVIKFSVYGMLVGFTAFLAGLTFDITTNEIFGYATIVASLVFVFFGIRHFRDTKNNGKVSFKQGIILGLMISVVTAIGIAIADYIYTAFVNPDFFTEYAEKIKAENPTAEIQEFTSAQAAVFMFVIVFIIGLIISLISSLILQRR